ncbi:hypothetical protein [Tepidibacter hydrothermalis]|uniref:Cytosolic protein n=1 Tax=Tepidibacter hydrothermalis TaxID=3036126 RepID=A0ABY8E7A9_9FIRM|nr:hypothetical protein [Tepidibacter hydrothermalis]WFD08731.1 hypothetical protein P4S50_10010 [Tepidibacter hydrothermalis]
MSKCNEENCTCPNTECERHGKCCQCINFHRELKSPVHCMKELVKSE